MVNRCEWEEKDGRAEANSGKRTGNRNRIKPIKKHDNQTISTKDDQKQRTHKSWQKEADGNRAWCFCAGVLRAEEHTCCKVSANIYNLGANTPDDDPPCERLLQALRRRLGSPSSLHPEARVTGSALRQSNSWIQQMFNQHDKTDPTTNHQQLNGRDLIDSFIQTLVF